MKCTGRRAREKCEGYLITVTFFFFFFPNCICIFFSFSSFHIEG
jgi:hypothetical protein